MSNKKKVMTSGNLAFAEAMRQINPDVVAAYPITPSTEIPMRFADFVANGKVDSEYVAVESEHSAISACVGASISGARVMTASSANGVALMHEIFPIAASFRAPIVFGLVNRSLGAPVNIHCDHSDSMRNATRAGCRYTARTRRRSTTPCCSPCASPRTRAC